MDLQLLDDDMEDRKVKAMDAQKRVEKPIDQLVRELEKSETRLPFVALTVFRDEVLPKSSFDWAKDPAKVRSLLKDATARCLILTSKMHNPDNPLEPTTTICLNRSGTRLEPTTSPSGSRLKPIQIPGLSLSDAVIQERREARY